MADKQWKDLLGYEGIYRISNYGDILSIKTNKILKTHINKKGYVGVCLTKDKKEKYNTIHRLVALTFLGNKPHLQVNHINGIKNDNFVDNLEWCSPSENLKHSYHNLNRKAYQSKVVLNLENGIFYYSAKDAANSSNLKYATLRAMLNGQNPNKTNLKFV